MITYKDLDNMGRLGNSLFEIASTIGIAEKCYVPYAFPEWKYQSFFKKPLPHLNGSTNGWVTLNEPTFKYHDHIQLGAGTNVNVAGYRQSFKYWEHCKPLVDSYFELTDHLQTELEGSHGAIFDSLGAVWSTPRLTSIHVRRGDYLKLEDYHTNLAKTNYYVAAIRQFKYTQFVIFSDDIEWCKSNLQFIPDPIYMEGTNEVHQLFLMAKCTNNILANSSFSWWAAYFNSNKDKKVIAPKNWFGPLGPKEHDLYLPGWIII